MIKHSVSIIIPFYDGDQYIIRCIDSIHASYSSDQIALSIYVIDNNQIASNYVEEIKAKNNVSYLKVNPKIGYGRACNIGADIAIKNKTDFLIFLNQDTHIYDGMIETLIKVLRKEKKPTIVSPMIFEYNKNQLHQMYIKAFLIENEQYFTDTYYGEMKDTYLLPNIGAACIAIKKEVIDEIGLFDPIFYMYSEDIDLMRRLQNNGGQILLATQAKVAHFEAMNEAPSKSTVSLLNLYQSALINEIRLNKNPIKLFKKECITLYSEKGERFALKYFIRGLKIILNPQKYKEPTIKELKNRITHKIQQDKLNNVI